jgi:diphthine synthase
MPFFHENWRPDSWYPKIAANDSLGAHTLVLLDIKVKEQSYENMARGRKIYEPPRFMTVAQCAQQLLEVEENQKRGTCRKDRLAVGAARVGSEEQVIMAGTLEQLAEADLGPPLHSLVLLGTTTHELEEEYVREFAIDRAIWDTVWKRDYVDQPKPQETTQDE